MIRRLLLDISANNPIWWTHYAYLTLCRILPYHSQAWLDRWCAWAGAETAILLPPPTSNLSTVAIIKDSQSAIVACEGTRNIPQILAEIIDSQQVSHEFITGKVHSFFLSHLLEQSTRILSELEGFNTQNEVVSVGHSLGGSVAHLLAQGAEKARLFRVKAVCTYGQPRTGDSTFVNALFAEYFRMTVNEDPIPGVPPAREWLTPLLTASVPTAIAWFVIPFHYVHGGVNWRLTLNRSLLFPSISLDREFFSISNELSNSALRLIPQALTLTNPLQNHFLTSYIRFLKPFVRRSLGNPDLTEIDELNDVMDNFGDPGSAPLPQLLRDRRGRFADPAVVVNGPPETVTVPPQDIGRTIETRGVSHSFLVYGGQPMASNTFKGHDRRMIKTALKVLSNIKARDTYAETNPKKTRKLSTRQIMFPVTQNPNVWQSLVDTINRLEALVAMTKSQ